MQNIIKFTLCAILCIICSKLSAQNRTFSNGYYENSEHIKTEGFFDLDRVDLNEVRFGKADSEKEMKNLDLKTLSKIVCNNGLQFLVVETNNKNEKEFLVLNTLLSGKVRLYRGFSKILNEEIFFIDSDKIPALKRINKSDPQSFLYTYFDKSIVPKHLRLKILYNRANIIDAVQRFDRIENYSEQERVKNVTDKYNTARFSIGFNANIFAGKGRANNDFDYDYTLKPSIGGGIFCRFNASHAVVLDLGFNYYNKSISAKDSIETTLKSPNHKTLVITYRGFPSLNYDVLEIPLSFTYRFYKTDSKWVPCVMVGTSLLNAKNIKYGGEMKRSSYTYDATIDFVDPEYTKFPTYPSDAPFQDQFKCFSFFTGGYVNKVINKHSSLDFGLKYTYESEVMIFSTLSPSTFKTNKFSLFLNYLYSF